MSTDVKSLWGAGWDDWAAACALAVEADDLAQALFAIARASPSDRRAARVKLSAWSQTVLKQRLAGQSGVEALRLVLVHGAGIDGVKDDYFDPQNSDLAGVVARGHGMPILVSAVWMIVGMQAGIEVHGVGLPGHFITRVDDTLVDPFRGGRAMSVEDCKALVEQATGGRASWDDRLLRPVSMVSLASRVVRNLINSAQRAKDGVGVYRYARLGAVLEADDVNAQLTWARGAEFVGARGEARQIYQRVARLFDGSPEARVASARAAALAGHRGSLH